MTRWGLEGTVAVLTETLAIRPHLFKRFDGFVWMLFFHLYFSDGVVFPHRNQCSTAQARRISVFIKLTVTGKGTSAPTSPLPVHFLGTSQ